MMKTPPIKSHSHREELVEDRDFHDWLWKRNDEDWKFRLLIWSGGVTLVVLFIGIPVSIASLAWRAWHGTTYRVETTPDALVQWGLLTLMWIHIFVGPFFKRWRNSKTSSDTQDIQSPRNAEFLLWLFLPREDREAAIGDTNEKFEMMIERFGARRAKLWYWGEVARSAWPLVSYIGERLLKWTFLGSAFDWLRRHI